MSADVCKFEHFIDTVSRYPEVTGRKLDVIGIYVAWRGLDITLPVAKFLTFYSRKATGYTIAETARDGTTRLKPFGKTLKDAIDFYLLHLNNLRHSITATELETLTVAEFDRRLKEEEISKKHYTSMRETLRKFVAKYDDTQISTLTGAGDKGVACRSPSRR